MSGADAVGDGRGEARPAADARASIARGEWIDLAVVTLLAFIAMAGFRPPYGGNGFVLAVAGGAIVGVGAAVVGRLLRLNALNTVLVGVIAYFLLGTPFALPAAGLWVVLPTLSSLSALAIGAVDSWRDVLTLATPITGPDHMAVLPYVATAAALLVSASVCLFALPKRPRSAPRAAAALAGPVALLALTMAAGTDRPFLAILRGALFVVVAVVWLGVRTRAGNLAVGAAARDLARRRVAGIAVLAIVAGLAAAGVGAVAAPVLDRDRFVLREELTPPFDPMPYVSPLAGFREYTKDERDTVLFTASGLQAGDRVKLATLDTYDGRQWGIASPEEDTSDAGTYRLAGHDLPVDERLTSGSTRDVEFRVDGYQDRWLPTVGSATSLDLRDGPVLDRADGLRFNGATGTGLVIEGLTQGDAYAVHADVQDAPIDGQLDNVPVERLDLPLAVPAPAALVERTQSYVQGETSDYRRIAAIEQALRSQGYLSHGTAAEAPSRAGHGLDRLQSMFEQRYLVGDEEQYASAMALMLRQLGYPARVVMGFAPPAVAGADGETAVRGADVTAWVEVPFEGFGWVAFSPTPDRTDVPVNTQEEPETKPKEQVRQPPQTEARPDDLTTAAEDPDEDEDRPEDARLPAWAVLLIAGVTIPLAAIGVPLLLAAIVRSRRRRRRRSTGPPDGRAAGAFEEAVDRLAELGYAVPVRETRRRTALAMHPGLADLADRADRAVFDGRDASPAEVDEVWAAAERLTGDAAGDSTRLRRLLARFRFGGRRSLRSRAARDGRGMTFERAELRNRILRSHGADRPSAETIARIEGVEPPTPADGDPRRSARESTRTDGRGT